MSDTAAWGAAAIAGGSLVVSVFALFKSSHAQREANAAQKRIVEIEEQRDQARQAEGRQAVLRPELRKTARGTDRLYIVNHGKAEARNVRVEVDGRSLAEYPAALGNDSMPDLIGPRSEVSCLLAFYQDCAPPFAIGITWDDDSAQGRTYRTTVTG